MGVNTTEFETFEHQFLELIGELQTITDFVFELKVLKDIQDARDSPQNAETSSESRLREALRAEATRAETAEAARDAAQREAAEARSIATAATSASTQASVALSKVHDELAATKMQFDLAERHRMVLEERCSEMLTQLESLDRELQSLRPLQQVHSNLQRQYTELLDRISNATRDTRREATRLESEVRRVEKCAGGGAEIRERARLAAAAHVRERRLAAAELQHNTHELHVARAEVTKLGALVAELQCRLSQYVDGGSSKAKNIADPDAEALLEARAALEAERAGTSRLERALAAALADNAALAARVHDNETMSVQPSSPKPDANQLSNICPIDSFLAD